MVLIKPRLWTQSLYQPFTSELDFMILVDPFQSRIFCDLWLSVCTCTYMLLSSMSSLSFMFTDLSTLSSTEWILLFRIGPQRYSHSGNGKALLLHISYCILNKINETGIVLCTGLLPSWNGKWQSRHSWWCKMHVLPKGGGIILKWPGLQNLSFFGVEGKEPDSSYHMNSYHIVSWYRNRALTL